MSRPALKVSAMLLAAALLAACGQKGPLYLPDEGLSSEVVPSTGAPAGPAPTTAPAAAPAPGNDAAPAGGDAAAPVTTSPDRSNEPRKRNPTP